MKAFPRADMKFNSLIPDELGMDLRDYFAAKAMTECIGWGQPDEISKKAYEYADAMMKAREE